MDHSKHGDRDGDTHGGLVGHHTGQEVRGWIMVDADPAANSVTLSQVSPMEMWTHVAEGVSDLA